MFSLRIRRIGVHRGPNGASSSRADWIGAWVVVSFVPSWCITLPQITSPDDKGSAVNPVARNVAHCCPCRPVNDGGKNVATKLRLLAGLGAVERVFVVLASAELEVSYSALLRVVGLSACLWPYKSISSTKPVERCGRKSDLELVFRQVHFT
ncbi:hypothetical protein GE09DRAFT_378481 [Coniochaeta sp. 2T2.1]|nr:hypothetical protein GE09DRAFT_378481 [Coniochaeta sp. 2T2.1]